VRELNANEGSIYRVAFSPQGDILVSVGDGRKIRAWNVNTGEIAYTISQQEDGAFDFAFNQDGSRMITGEDDTLNIWDTATGELISSRKTGGCCIAEIETSPDGNHLAVLGYPKLEFYDLNMMALAAPNWKISASANYGFLTFNPDGSNFAYVQADFSNNLTLFIHDITWTSTPDADIPLWENFLPMGNVL